MAATLRDDYSGPFDPERRASPTSRAARSRRLGREYLLHGHLQDRVGIPLVLAQHTRQDMLDVAIEEWMAASPLYSLRTQRALNFGNADVPTIFKNIQLDIGAPHQFMDFRYKVDDAQHGEFWLDHCGALMDVEPMGEEFVHGMCHDIEDPTFDATAGATNPYAQVRPIHRPPRVPGRPRAALPLARRDRPRDGAPVEPHPTDGDRRRVGDRADRDRRSRPRRRARRLVRLLGRLRSRLHARGSVAPRARGRAAGGRGADAPARARVPATASRAAGASTRRSRTRRRCSPAPRASRAGRLPAVLGITGDDAEAIAKLLQLHPVFQPRTYVAPAIEVIDDRTVRFALRDAPCFHERDDLSWFASMARRAVARARRDRAGGQPARVERTRRDPRRRAARLAHHDRSRRRARAALAERRARAHLDRRDRHVPPAARPAATLTPTLAVERARFARAPPVDDRTWHLWEQYAHPFLRCNVWLVRGRDRSMLVDSGLGVVSLSDAARRSLRPAARRGRDALPLRPRRLAARVRRALRAPGGRAVPRELATRSAARCAARGFAPEAWQYFLDSGLRARRRAAHRAARRPASTSTRTRSSRARRTTTLDEGDVIDLGDVAYEVLHLPGPLARFDRPVRPRRAARCSPATRCTTGRCSTASTTAAPRRTSRRWNGCASCPVQRRARRPRGELRPRPPRRDLRRVPRARRAAS